MPIASDKDGGWILNLLKQELELPENIVELTLHIGVDKIITIDCTYYTEDHKHRWIEATNLTEQKRHFICVDCGATKEWGKK